MTLPPELETIKHIINIKISAEGPSNWVFRGLIEDIDEYVLDSIALILDEQLPENMEYEIREDRTLCDIKYEEDCEKTIIVELYIANYEKPVAFVVFDRVIGDNTYVFKLRKIILAEEVQA